MEMFENELRERLNSRCQVVTPGGTYSGILVGVTSAMVTVRIPPYPGYGGGEDVMVSIGSIAYVRFFE